jgi:serine/threonine protein kinase
MNDIDRQIIKKYYKGRNLDNDNNSEKLYDVYTVTSDNFFKPVILKEMDEKRAQIYYVLSTMWNPHIANVYSVHRLSNSTVTENNKTKQLYLAVTECITNENGETTLSEYVKRNGHLDEKSALLICMQICDGLEEIHKAGFIHKDLKPDNIMVSNEKDDNGLPIIKIIDFGVADEAEHLQDATVIKTSFEDAGTVGYNPHDKKVTPRWDVYSIGCILNFLLTGHTPYIGIYNASWSVRRIIERATDDFSARYSSVDLLSRVMAHEARLGLMDRIPILRSLPGYRSHTLWKELIATPYYLTMAYFIAYECIIGNSWALLTELVFWFFLPVIIVFDPFNWFIRIKKVRTLRKNTYVDIIVKVILIFVCFFMPIVITSLMK